jgi:hypothetical protein
MQAYAGLRRATQGYAGLRRATQYYNHAILILDILILDILLLYIKNGNYQNHNIIAIFIITI